MPCQSPAPVREMRVDGFAPRMPSWRKLPPDHATIHQRRRSARTGDSPVPKVTMPQLGESVAEGTIGKWLKNVGDHVDKYEPIVEVITDKVNAEVPSPFEGTLSAILVQEGETVPNNTEIAVIETAAG